MKKVLVALLVVASSSQAATLYPLFEKTGIPPTIVYGVTNYQSSGTPALLIPSTSTGIGMNLARSGSTSSLDVADWFFHRSANYVGGTTGHVNAAIYAKTFGFSGALGYEWNGLFVMDNSSVLADASQNLALAAIGYKRASGHTWARYAELDDDIQDSTGTAVTDEVDLYANGTQVNNNRIIMHLVAGPKTYGGTAHIEYGMKFSPSTDGGGASSNATVDNAWLGCTGDYKYCIHATGGSSVVGGAVIRDDRTGTGVAYGLDMGGAYVSGFLYARDNKKLIWSNDQHTTTSYVAADDCLEDLTQSTKLWQVCMDGHMVVNGNAIFTSPASNQFQFGNADAAAPANQTVSTQGSRGGTDTDTAGGNLIIQSGSGTGSATGSSITFKTPTATTTGTTQQTETTALSLSSLVVSIGSTYQFGWSGRAQFISPAAATVQVGGTNSATPTAQTFQTQGSRAGTDTDIAGANLTIVSGLGTGSATGSTLTLQTPKAGSTGTTAETAVNAFSASATAISIGNATSNPATTFLGTGIVAVTGALSPSTTAGIVGTAAADSPNAGSVGQVASIHCIVGTAAQVATTVTMTIATPAVVTWSSHTFVPSSGLANYTCPINFTTTGALPTGVVVGTNYFIIGSSVSGDTFQISDTAAHALAGTNAVATSGSQSGTQAAYIGNLGTNGSAFNAAGLALVAGDWDCTDVGEFQELTTLTTVRFATGVGTVSANLPAIGNFADNRTVSGAIGANSYYLAAPVVQENISATTNIYAITNAGFSVGTMNEGAFLRCRRMR